MSNARKRAVLKCICCVSSCYSVTANYTYHVGISAEDYGITDVDLDTLILWWQDGYFRNQHRCWRLLVYEAVTVASDVIGTITTPDHVLATNGLLQRKASGGGPFHETGPDTGDLLDAPPYWYATCNAGGRSLSTIAALPTTADVNAAWAATPVPDGTYTMLVLCMARRRYRKASAPGGYEEVPSTDAQYQIRKVLLID